ncbi:MAG: N-acetyltransferase family protein [Gemmatimonadota bacterium]
MREIYLEGIGTQNATFETSCPDWEEWDAKHLEPSRLVAEVDGRVVCWAALSPVSDRCVYGGVAEVSVYIAADQQGKGIGSHLLSALVDESEKHGFWTLQAGTFPENSHSIALHQKFGFREVGRRKRLGKLGGRWRDVVLLERRSDVVGVD